MKSTNQPSKGANVLRPGDKATFSGIYRRNDGEQVVSTQGKPLPPGPQGATYKPIIPAKHKG